MDTCPICGSPSNNKDEVDPRTILCDCYRCGKFKLLEDGILALNGLISGIELNDITKIYISGWIREHQDSNIIIDKERLKSLMSLPELSVFEKADRILIYLAKKFPIAGTYIPYEFHKTGRILALIKARKFPVSINEAEDEFYKNANDLLPIVALGRVVDIDEFRFIWDKYLIGNKHYFSSRSEDLNNITPEGWAYLETFRHPNPNSRKAFVAMWFTDEMEKIYDDHIRKAIEDAGYKSVQIGRKEHNNDINDEIIGEIRNSKFVVADFTGNRGGVYFESGFANGLNIEVIHTCRKDHLKDVHFDINHRNIIVWENGEDLYKKLLNRIKATIV